ncbi:conjugal transfer protein TraG N-terminal domain-containing protein [Geobacter sp. DSM 9736]|uniref:conjugal transfer protein TraG N-terminal domain-containing protein n=1 Tax=Geobacter sp. DSM 9736 TaxID=1277350 RepID=UPI000B5111DC|nr:conjugal transfer protein TraG N-terminal domain-containing protein [Geobacter sp. DSM 9736]SNB45439.1 conjugal transfer mating pair stabilization protein TraG [Geobacter sp. DSM 9736]
MKRRTIISATILLIVIVPSAALAVDFDYYVYGGFDAVVNAFNKLALVFGDNGYMSFYAFSIAAGIFFGCVTIAARILGGGNGSPMSWIVPSLVGIGVYLSLAVPKGNLHIYDPVYNKNQTIGGIPNGVVAIAGVLNAVERGLVDIVTTSGDPLSYENQAGGKGFLGLYQISSLPLSAVNSNIDTSMRNYIKDCVSYEIMRPGTTLTVDALRKTSTDFAPLLAQAQNPSVYTVYYDSTTSNGQSLTCTDAWANISGQLTPDNLKNNITAVCSALGYDPSNAASLTQCKTVLNNVNTGVGLGAASVDDFVKQAYISQRLDDIFRSGNSAGATNYQFLLNASGSMKAANEWLPVLRAILTAIAVGLVPFLALFIPTPIIGKAVGAIFGFFVWLAAWGVTDAIIHQFAIDYANRTYQLVRQNNLGMDAFYFFPDQTTKILGMFGTLRMSGMMLATALTGMLVKFGGHAMAMMAGSLSKQIQSAGSRAAHEVEDPAGRASSIQRNSSAVPTQAWGNEHSFWARGNQSYLDMTSKTTASSDLVDSFGLGGASRMMADGGIGKTVGFGGKGAAMRQAGLDNSYGLSIFDGKAGLAQSGALRDVIDKNYGGNLDSHAQMKVANDAALGKVFGTAENYKGFLEKNLDRNVGQLDGEVKAYEGAQALGFQGNWRQFNAFRSEMQGLGDYTNAAAVNQVASKYGLTSGQALQMKAQFQNARHLSESAEMSAKLGGAINAGAEMGNVVAAESAGKVHGVYMSGGYEHFQTMASHDVTGKGARYDLVRGAADQMVDRIAPQLKSDPEMYQGEKLTDKGFAQMQKAMEGQNINFTTSDGRHTMNVGMDGNVVNSNSQGVVASGDKAAAETLKQDLRKAGFGKNAVSEVDRMMKAGKGFAYDITRDRAGNIESFSINRGGEVNRRDMATFRVGRDAESVDRDVRTVDRGLRETVGSFIKTGYEHTDLNLSRKTGAYNVSVGGKEMKVNGDWYYGRNEKTGKMELVGGSFSSGLDSSVLMYSKDRDGDLHFAKVEGKMDARGNLVAGKTTDITEQEFVQFSQHGAAVVSSRGGGGVIASVRADGGVKADFSSRQVTGTRVTSDQNLAGSAATKDFTEGRSIDAGTAATMIAIGRDGLHETAGMVGDVTKVIGPYKAAVTRQEETVMQQSREATAVAREAEARVQRGLQKTGKILQHQSKNSPLPKSGVPAPSRGPKR